MRMIARFFAFLFGTATLVGLLGAAVVGYVVWHYSQDLPDHAQLAKYEPPVPRPRGRWRIACRICS